MERITVKLLRTLLETIPFVTVNPDAVYDIFDELRKSRISLDRKVEQAAISLKKTSSLISELEVDLKDRSEKIKILKDEIDRYSKISEVEEDKARVILTEIQTALDKGKKLRDGLR